MGMLICPFLYDTFLPSENKKTKTNCCSANNHKAGIQSFTHLSHSGMHTNHREIFKSTCRTSRTWDPSLLLAGRIRKQLSSLLTSGLFHFQQTLRARHMLGVAAHHSVRRFPSSIPKPVASRLPHRQIITPGREATSDVGTFMK